MPFLVDPVNAFGLPAQARALFSLAVAAFVLLWVGYPILRKTLMALRQRVLNANVLLSAGAWIWTRPSRSVSRRWATRVF